MLTPRLDILEQLAIENLQKLPTEDQKNAFAQTLKKSITLDPNGSKIPKPASPYLILTGQFWHSLLPTTGR